MADSGSVFISERLSTKCVINKVPKISAKTKRSRNRYLRRKRSRRHYRKTAKEARIRRNSTDILTEVSVYDFTGMAEGGYPDLPKEVSDWQYYHQLAYWKSRAISLEFENRMLHAHLKKICSKEIQDYVEYGQAELERSAIDDVDSNRTDDCKNPLLAEDVVGDLNLYGEATSKIKAMEMAMEVNFKMQVDNKKPVMWPNIPLNL